MLLQDFIRMIKELLFDPLALLAFRNVSQFNGKGKQQFAELIEDNTKMMNALQTYFQ